MEGARINGESDHRFPTGLGDDLWTQSAVLGTLTRFRMNPLASCFLCEPERKKYSKCIRGKSTLRNIASRDLGCSLDSITYLL